MTIQLPLLLKTHRKIYNKSLLNQFLQDVLQVNTNHVGINITGFIDSFGDIIATADDDINNFV